MYLEHFGLAEAPFSIAPNPHYLFMSSRHRDALAHLLYGVQTDGGFILLTGEVGTGKTTLCRCLLEQIPSDVDTAYVLNPRVTVAELLATICDEYGISYEREDSSKHLVDLLNRFLLEGHARRRRAVVIIDEAQNLSAEVLEQLRLLTNLETNERKLLQIILLGQPELLELLAQRELRQFSQRITARFHLDSLNLVDTGNYIAHRLEIAGLKNNLKYNVFNPQAIKAVFKLSQGTPRVINLICDRALLGAYAEGRGVVSADIVRRAAKEVLGEHPTSGRQNTGTFSPWIWAVAALVLIMLGAATWTFVVQPPATLLPGPPARVASQSQQPRELTPEIPDLQGHADLKSAYHDLFAIWGSAFEDRSRPACELANDIGLMCTRRPVSLATLTRLNRPAIVSDGTSYLTVTRATSDQVTLIAGGNQFELERRQFEAAFTGDMYLLWRTPPMYRENQPPLRRNDSGPAVDWLATQLALIEGRAPPGTGGLTFDEELESRVMNFQASTGLPVTGIVDVDTWIHLNSAQPVSIPLLAVNQPG